MFESGELNLSEYDEATEFALVPEGEYHVVCTDHKPMKSKAGNTYWNLDLMILSGDYAGTMIRDGITFMNPKKPGLDEKEIKSARATLGQVKHVLKRLGGVDTDKTFQLAAVNMRGRQALVYVKLVAGRINEATNQPFPDKNEVKMGSYREIPEEQYLPTNVKRATPPPTAAASTQPPVNGAATATATAIAPVATATAEPPRKQVDW